MLCTNVSTIPWFVPWTRPVKHGQYSAGDVPAVGEPRDVVGDDIQLPRNPGNPDFIYGVWVSSGYNTSGDKIIFQTRTGILFKNTQNRGNTKEMPLLSANVCSYLRISMRSGSLETPLVGFMHSTRAWLSDHMRIFLPANKSTLLAKIKSRKEAKASLWWMSQSF